MAERRFGRNDSNGRATPRRGAGELRDYGPTFRQRSPLAYWVALVVLIGLVATLLGGVIASLAR